MNTQMDLIPIPDDFDLAAAVAEGVGELPDGRRASVLVDMVRVVEAQHRRQGLGDSEALQLALSAVMALAEYFGGRMWYLPRGDKLRHAVRDIEIFRKAGKVPVRDLAEAYELSETQIYRIIRQQHDLHLSRIQGRLFEDQEGT